jgi:hypothetical protein
MEMVSIWEDTLFCFLKFFIDNWLSKTKKHWIIFVGYIGGKIYDSKSTKNKGWEIEIYWWKVMSNGLILFEGDYYVKLHIGNHKALL